MFVRARLAALLFMFIVAPALGEDDEVGVQPPEMTLTTGGPITVKDTHIKIYNGDVIVDDDIDVSNAATLSLQFARFAWAGEGDSYPDKGFSELRIIVDDEPATISEQSTESFAGTDVTALIHKAGLDPLIITGPVPVVSAGSGVRASAYAKLQAIGAIAQLGGRDLARWSVTRRLSWPLSKGRHDVQIHYQARPSTSLRDLRQLQPGTTPRQYCLTPQIFAKAAAIAGFGGHVIVNTYVIPAGRAGRADSPNLVDISVTQPDGADSHTKFIAFCGANNSTVTASGAMLAGAVRPDRAGNVNILTLDSPTP